MAIRFTWHCVGSSRYRISIAATIRASGADTLAGASDDIDGRRDASAAKGVADKDVPPEVAAARQSI